MTRRRILACVLPAALAACSNDPRIISTPACADPEPTPAALGGGGGVPASAEALAAAMGAPPSASPPTFTGSTSAAAVFAGLGVLEPTHGPDFAWLSTGVAGANTPSSLVPGASPPEEGTDLGAAGCGGETFDCAVLRVSFVVPPGHRSVRFDFGFLSTEYPEFVDYQYNDAFRVRLQSVSHSFDNVVFDGDGDPITIKSALFRDDECVDFANTGFDILDEDGDCDAGSTGLLATIAPVEPGETATLTFTLQDTADALYDSAVFIDRLETTETAIDEPETNDCD